MKQELTAQLEQCFNQDRDTLLDLTFNQNHSFYEEPQDFNDYLDLIDDLKEKELLKIIFLFNN